MHERNKIITKKGEVIHLSMAGVQGFEPRLADPESAVLPLNDTPTDLIEIVLSSLCGRMIS